MISKKMTNEEKDNRRKDIELPAERGVFSIPLYNCNLIDDKVCDGGNLDV
jgi:hypothetical protein